MNPVTIIFYLFISLAAFGAVGILFSRNVFKSALYLLMTLLSVAALYAMSFAEFLSVAQILVYAGGITVIIIFGIMLTTRIAGRPLVVTHSHILSGATAGLGLFVILLIYLPAFPGSEKVLTPENISTIALEIFGLYSLPFEVSGLLLLIALVGAAVITSNIKTRT